MLKNANNVGYIIPVEIIEYFLNDIEINKVFKGISKSGIHTITTENKSIQNKYDLKDGFIFF
jgi:hypothetical protein